MLFDQILNPDSKIDDDVEKQIDLFWNDPAESLRLKSQNVRVAFLILALANVDQDKLNAIRDEASALLVERQRVDGAWGDWATENGSGPPRQVTTAWILFALSRANADKHVIKSAQEYLMRFVGADEGSRQSISDFAAASLLETLPKGEAPARLLARTRAMLRQFGSVLAERISFFDYAETSVANEPPSLKRDYLCYPALLPFALMTAGLTRHSGFFGQYFAAKARITLAESLERMVGSGQYYVLPGAAKPSTVDQAAMALSFNSLRDSERFLDLRLSKLKPIFSAVRENVLTRVVVPLFAAVFALIAIQDPDHLLWFVPAWTWIDKSEIQLVLTIYDTQIRLGAGVYLFFANSTPGKVYGYIRDHWFR
ncbi:MAG: hypothetical protein ABJV68_26215 [Paracoccaceae bacterium]